MNVRQAEGSVLLINTSLHNIIDNRNSMGDETDSYRNKQNKAKGYDWSQCKMQNKKSGLHTI
jgi:hypothetical protein